MVKLLEDEEDVELADSTVEKVKTEDLLLGGVDVMVANEVCDGCLNAADVDIGWGACVSTGASTLGGDVVQI